MNTTLKLENKYKTITKIKNNAVLIQIIISKKFPEKKNKNQEMYCLKKKML